MDNQKKILYIDTVEDGPFKGVKKKISMQCKALERLGLNVLSISSGKRSTRGQIEKLLPFSYGINYRIVKQRLLQLEQDSLDYCYIRYTPASRGLIDVMRTVKTFQKNVKIILEIPTYPYDGEKKTIKDIPDKIRDGLYRDQMKEYVNLLITPSHIDEERIFGIPALEITNGIDIDSIKMRTPVKRQESVINLIGVAMVSPFHGFERLINGIYQYKKCKKSYEPDVHFYIIGTGSAKSELEELRTNLHLEDEIIFTGKKENEELDYFYNIADVGIGSLGLYKIGLSNANSLKTREYCAKGLPFVVTDCDYMFTDNSFEYCLVFPNDDSPIDVPAIIQFVEKNKRSNSDEVVASTMRDFAKTHFSWSTILEKVIEKVDNI